MTSIGEGSGCNINLVPRALMNNNIVCCITTIWCAYTDNIVKWRKHHSRYQSSAVANVHNDTTAMYENRTSITDARRFSIIE